MPTLRRPSFRVLALQSLPQRMLQSLLVALLLGTVVLGSTGLFAAARRSQPTVGWPLPDAQKRDMPLSFGLYMTPDSPDNPIDPPERFTGWHAAQDFEILPGEEKTDVPVLAVCPGNILLKKHADGYGGVIVQSCVIGGRQVTVLYGHLSLQQTRLREGDAVRTGQQLAILAPADSGESGFTRKHLHLGIHAGTKPDLLGYVQEESELTEFINPLTVLGKRQ